MAVMIYVCVSKPIISPIISDGYTTFPIISGHVTYSMVVYGRLYDSLMADVGQREMVCYIIIGIIPYVIILYYMFICVICMTYNGLFRKATPRQQFWLNQKFSDTKFVQTNVNFLILLQPYTI